MWTYSGIFVEKREEDFYVYANDSGELEMFSDKCGKLYDEYKSDDMKEDGLYQCWIGYGSWDTPKIYKTKKVTSLNWDFAEVKR